MKKSSIWILAACIVAGLIIGFFVGLKVDVPKLQDETVTGTIKKVDKYKNTKASETDIQLRNDLVSDTATLHMLKNYISFNYLESIKMADNIDFAVQEATAVEAFISTGKEQIERLANYGLFLSTSRRHFLMALSVCEDPSSLEPAIIRDALNQANNVIAQKNYRNSTVLDFIGQLEIFLAGNQASQYEGLKKAHDLLTVNLAHSSAVLGDKVMQKYLGKKQLVANFKQLNWYDPTRMTKLMKQDVELLGPQYILAAEKLGIFMDAEKMGFSDNEKLGTLREAEKLGALDQEKMGIIRDVEKMDFIADAEKLGPAILTLFSSERLGMLIVDVEKFGIAVFDADRLGQFMDTEKMGEFMDTEKMGGAFMNSEKMGIWFDADKLGIVLDAANLGEIVI